MSDSYHASSIAIAYCNLEFLGLQPETPRTSYIFNIGTHTQCYITVQVTTVCRGPHQAPPVPLPALPPGLLRVQPEGRSPASGGLLQRAGLLVGRQEGRQAGGGDQPLRLSHRAGLQDHVDTEQDPLRVLHSQH